jgi:hypothetical protein
MIGPASWPASPRSSCARWHAELEGLDRAQDGLVEDTTPRIRDLLEMVWKQEAAQRDDPEGYLVAAKVHYERVGTTI